MHYCQEFLKQLGFPDARRSALNLYRAAGCVGIVLWCLRWLRNSCLLYVRPVHQAFDCGFGSNRETVSAAFGAASLSIAVFSPIAWRLHDRFGARKVLLPLLMVFAVAYASLAFLTPSLVHLYAVFILLGVVGNACEQMGYCRAISTWFTRRRGFALALMLAGTGVGAT